VNDRDKIQALWVTMEMTMNALEQLNEGIRLTNRDDFYAVVGDTGRVIWDHDTRQWVWDGP
jgi:hypothetical protein